MAKLLFVLMGVLLILQGMTFLLVVNHEGASGKGASAAQAPPMARTSEGSDKQTQKLDSMVQTLTSVSRSVGDLTRKVDELQRKVGSMAMATASKAAAASSPPTMNTARERAPAAAMTAGSVGAGTVRPAFKPNRAPPAVRTAPTDFSRLPNGASTTTADDEGNVEDAAAETAKPNPGTGVNGVGESPGGDDGSGNPAEGAAPAGEGNGAGGETSGAAGDGSGAVGDGAGNTPPAEEN